jgi:hypothetical protein
MGTDTYDGWTSLMRQWDTTYSIPNIDRHTKPGSYSFLDQMIIGDLPHRQGSAYGPGLTHDEAVAHMSMFVMVRPHRVIYWAGAGGWHNILCMCSHSRPGARTGGDATVDVH